MIRLLIIACIFSGSGIPPAKTFLNKTTKSLAKEHHLTVSSTSYSGHPKPDTYIVTFAGTSDDPDQLVKTLADQFLLKANHDPKIGPLTLNDLSITLYHNNQTTALRYNKPFHSSMN